MALYTEPRPNFFIRNRFEIDYQQDIISGEIWSYKIFINVKIPIILHSAVFDAQMFLQPQLVPYEEKGLVYL